ncbi:hypothetical protein UT300005_32910 [Clostridium sp. CTA-5]
MDHILTMSFLTQTGKKTSITINGVKEDVNADQVKALMNLIIEKEVFFVNGGLLKAIDSAQLTNRAITKFDLK